MIELMKQLCALPGPSGCEDAVREFVLEKVKPFADEMKTDAIGNIMVFRKGKKALERPVVLCAHMDEVGVIIKKITDDGMLKFGFVGGVDPRVVIGRPVRFGDVQGVIGIKAVHLTTAAERRTMPKTKDLYIDIGASGREAAMKLAPPGTYGCFVSQPEEFGGGFFKARAIDDRIGCAIMLELLKEELPLDVTFAFTAQEEVGTRGAFGAAFSVTPSVALVLETTTAADLPSVDDHRRVCAPGKGPVISYMDGATIYDRDLFEDLRRLAEDNGIPWQTKEYIAGGNDARTIQRTKQGVRVAAMSAATRYLHAPSSVGSIADFENMLKLTRLFLADQARQL